MLTVLKEHNISVTAALSAVTPRSSERAASATKTGHGYTQVLPRSRLPFNRPLEIFLRQVKKAIGIGCTGCAGRAEWRALAWAA
jgi:hypothetical protein